MKYIGLVALFTVLIVAACTTQLNEQNNNLNNMPSLEGKEGTKDPSSNLDTEDDLNEDIAEDEVKEVSNQPLVSGTNAVTAAELSAHNNEKDCWVAYQGKVYDVTVFLPLHPGGVGPILKYCGTSSEFEQGFTKKHGTSKVNILLQQIYKGDLA